LDTKHFKSTGDILRKLRIKNKLPLRKVAALLDIDQSYLSKIERGIKNPSEDQIIKLANILKTNVKELLIHYYSDNILHTITNDDLAKDALKVAEKKLEIYLKEK
jgi:transcriptional regulator with XRE-family HTH domain